MNERKPLETQKGIKQEKYFKRKISRNSTYKIAFQPSQNLPKIICINYV